MDRNAIPAFMRMIAWYSQRSESVIQDMTLQEWVAALTPWQRKSPQIRSSWVPWINTLGVYHRSRKRHGMQYCSGCLAEADFYRKVWRLSFVTVCHQHACALLDRCQHCAAPIAFHRNEAFHLHCHECGRSLIHEAAEAISDHEYQTRLALQQTMLAALNDGKLVIANEVVSSQHFFLGASVLLRAVKKRLRVDQRNPHKQPLCFACPTGQIEMLGLDGRARQCTVLAQFLDDWPRNFLKLAVVIGLTQRTFERTVSLPEWLQRIVAQLPIGEIRVRRKHRSVVREELRRIHRHKATGWRTERASLLLKLAGRPA